MEDEPPRQKPRLHVPPPATAPVVNSLARSCPSPSSPTVPPDAPGGLRTHRRGHGLQGNPDQVPNSHTIPTSIPSEFPRIGVGMSGATAPLEDVMARRADAAPINRIPYVPMSRKVKGLAVLPSANNCQDSTEKAWS